MFLKTLAIALVMMLVAVLLSIGLAAWALGRVRQGPYISANWSGYVYSGGYYTDIAGTFDVPVQTVPSGAASEWVGIGGFGTPTIIQAGVDEIAGNPEPEAWVELYPGPSQLVPLTVEAGDEVSVGIDQLVSPTGPTDYWRVVMTIGDHTWSHVYLYQQKPSTAEWITEAPAFGGIVAPMGDYGTVRWSEPYLQCDRTCGALHRVQLSAKGVPASIPSRTFSFTTGFTTRWAP